MINALEDRVVVDTDVQKMREHHSVQPMHESSLDSLVLSESDPRESVLSKEDFIARWNELRKFDGYDLGDLRVSRWPVLIATLGASSDFDAAAHAYFPRVDTSIPSDDRPFYRVPFISPQRVEGEIYFIMVEPIPGFGDHKILGKILPRFNYRSKRFNGVDGQLKTNGAVLVYFYVYYKP